MRSNNTIPQSRRPINSSHQARPKLDADKRLERRIQRSPLLPASDRIRWQIDSLSYANGKLTMSPEHIATRCNSELRVVNRVLREDVQAGYYKVTGEWSYVRVDRWDKPQFEARRVAGPGSTAMHLIRVIMRVSSKNGTAIIGDMEMSARLGVTPMALYAARAVIKKLGFLIVEGNGRGKRTIYWHPDLGGTGPEKTADKPPAAPAEDDLPEHDPPPRLARSALAERFLGKDPQATTSLPAKAAKPAPPPEHSTGPRFRGDVKPEPKDARLSAIAAELADRWREARAIPDYEVRQLVGWREDDEAIPEEELVHLAGLLPVSRDRHLYHFLVAHAAGKRRYLDWLALLPAGDDTQPPENDERKELVADIVHYATGPILDGFMERIWKRKLSQPSG